LIQNENSPELGKLIEPFIKRKIYLPEGRLVPCRDLLQKDQWIIP
jgi:hypothetical protein